LNSLSQTSCDVEKPAQDPSRLRIVEWVLLLSVLACASFTIARSWIRIHYDYQLDYAEGSILNSSWRLAQGGALYRPLHQAPYQIDPYPPFIYKAVGFVVAHTGLNFFYPRLLALLAALATCLMASILVRHWTRRWELALAFGLLPLTIPIVQPWLGVLRYDFIGLALTFAGLAVFEIFPKHRFWSLPFFFLAVSGLYTLIAAPAACCLYLWTTGQKKKGVLFGALLTAAMIAGVLYGHHVTGGWMERHLFKSQHSPFSISQLASFVQGILRTNPLLLLLSTVILIKSFKERKPGVLPIYLCTVAATSFTLGKVGAASNHMLQLIVVASISAAVAYDWMCRNANSDWGLVLALSSLALVTLANTPLRTRRPIEELSECGKAYAAIKDGLGERILADNVGALLMAHKPVYVSDPFAYRWLVATGELPDEDLRRMIVKHEFSSIVVDRVVEGDESDLDRWPLNLRAEMRNNYQLTKEFTCNDAKFVYEPRQASPPATAGRVASEQNTAAAISRTEQASEQQTSLPQ
jgi:hypothetical protein